MPSNLERKARRKQQKQTKLVFEPSIAGGSSPAATLANVLSPAKVRYSLRGGDRDGDKRRGYSGGGSKGEGEVSMKPKMRNGKAMVGSGRQMEGLSVENFETEDEDEDEGEGEGETDSYYTADARPSARSRIPSKMKRSPAEKSSRREISLSDDSDSQFAMTARPNMFSGKKSSAAEDESDSGSDSEEILAMTRKQRGPKAARAKPIVIEDSDEDDIYITSSVVQKGKAPAPQVSDEDSEEEPITSPLKRRRPVNLRDSSSPDSDISPTKRRKRAAIEIEEESADSDLLSPSRIMSRSRSKSVSSTPPRYTRQKKEKKHHRSDREKALELAKRRRAGDKSELTPSDSELEEGDDSNLEHLSDFEDDDDDDNEGVVEKAESGTSRRGSKGTPLVVDEDDFIVEDDEETLGVDISIPLEFTSKNHQKPKEHFRYAIEWMVHKKLNPGFQSTDEIYLRAFQVLGSKPSTLAESKYGSSAWTGEFYRALNARPTFCERKIFSDEALAIQGEHRCQACNRGKHPSTYAVRFEGKAYSKETLDEVEQDEENVSEDAEDSEAESGSESPSPKRAASVDARGNPLPAESKEWFSGQFCFRKAQTAHLLIHWKHELYQWVLDTLEREGELKEKKIVKRDQMKARERRDYANGVVDRWAAKGGEIDGLWRDYDAQIKVAEETVLDRKFGR